MSSLNSKLSAIGNAIRSKTMGGGGSLTLEEMRDEIEKFDISSGIISTFGLSNISGTRTETKTLPKPINSSNFQATIWIAGYRQNRPKDISVIRCINNVNDWDSSSNDQVYLQLNSVSFTTTTVNINYRLNGNHVSVWGMYAVVE